MEQKNNIILHPSLDIKDNVLVLGFRDKKFDEEKEKTVWNNIYLFATTEGESYYLDIITNSYSNHEKYNDYNYIFEDKTDDKTRVLVDINSRWSREKFDHIETDHIIDRRSPKQIYENIFKEVKEYLELEKEEDYHILTSWIIGTYFFLLFKAFPYLHIKGMKGSGKTTALDFMRLACFNGFKERSTMPSFRDNVDSQRGTALIDQADKRFGTQSEDDMIDVMVDSYKASSGFISKMVPAKGKFVRTEYNAYCPKAFASTKELHFDLRDRCIQIQFIRSSNNKNQIDSDNEKWLEIRDSLYQLLIRNYVRIKPYINEVENIISQDTEIIGRMAELWKPIETIMRLCEQDEQLINKIKNSFKVKNKFVEAGLSILETEIVKIINKELEGFDSKWLSSKDFTSLLIIDDGEWEEKTDRSKTQLIGNLITRLNLHSQKKHKNGGNYYLFEKEKIEKITNAYIDDIKEDIDLSPVVTSPNIVENKEEF